MIQGGKDGNFYGTTTQGGTNGYGTLFSMDTNGNVTVLTSFDSASGASPYSQLVQVASGNIYGPTLYGGTNNNNGTLFTLSPNHTFTSLYSFGDTNLKPGPQIRYSSLVQAADGSLYGTTYVGGANGPYGTIYRLSMKSPGAPTLAILPKGASVCFKWNSQSGAAYQLQFTSLPTRSLGPTSGPKSPPLTTPRRPKMLLLPASSVSSASLRPNHLCKRLREALPDDRGRYCRSFS